MPRGAHTSRLLTYTFWRARVAPDRNKAITSDRVRGVSVYVIALAPYVDQRIAPTGYCAIKTIVRFMRILSAPGRLNLAARADVTRRGRREN